MYYRQRLLAIVGMLLAGFVLLVLLFWLVLPKKNLHTVRFDRVSFNVRIADSEKEREQGLSGTTELPSNRGMLFVFESSGFWGIWMKDMNYPIDILWLNDRKEVVHIEQHILPESYPRTFMPRVPARYVLELPADATEKHGIKQGDSATFRLP